MTLRGSDSNDAIITAILTDLKNTDLDDGLTVAQLHLRIGNALDAKDELIEELCMAITEFGRDFARRVSDEGRKAAMLESIEAIENTVRGT